MPSTINSPSIGASSLTADVESAGGSTVLPAARASLPWHNTQSRLGRFVGLLCGRGVLLLAALQLLTVAFLSSAKVFAEIKVWAAYVHLNSSPAIADQHKVLL